MKVERLNDNQIRFIFMQQDLADRNININDFVSRPPSGSHGLFQEITGLLQSEYGFATIGTPLMFEATMSNDSLWVTVTKMNPADGMNGLQNMMGGIMSHLNPQMLAGNQGFVQAHIPNTPPNMPHQQGAPTGNQQHRRQKQKPPPKKDYVLYSFDNFDIMAMVASRIGSNFNGDSHVYKMEGRYYLLLKTTELDNIIVKKLESLLCDFGKKELSGPIAYNQMMERGEVIIAEDAVRKLKMYGQY